MKKQLLALSLEVIVVLSMYELLLYNLGGTNIVAGIFCPGPHLPHYHPALIGLFLILRLYIVLLPGMLLSRIGHARFKQRAACKNRPLLVSISDQR